RLEACAQLRTSKRSACRAQPIRRRRGDLNRRRPAGRRRRDGADDRAVSRRRGDRFRRERDTFERHLFQASTAAAFYRLMAVLGVELVHNHADYRLMSRKALQALMEYNEANLFLRGLVSSMGLATEIV